ncbi:hypothetical protein [Marinilactibacillus psychrotolerans]|uniref:Uncharacterized protein n=1 Tax=Marinilactibacillus psychrotolerans TaxID=191770 RepID=A0AAV3WTT7_9LACT|nr:hypothetical protein [Marinilactibacillus psychrotolerans]GEL67234.1 hypothetical protein MPS01_13890 [Marinilactibacillus psychrotolerans]GEQ36038.1 hypothetical protein M132T_15460 [Marinilactibacillus psychrotolerans]SDC60903.1 hypothetical protein SAMN04488013_10750 [Marinilactibacillus psychrotolerans]
MSIENLKRAEAFFKIFKGLISIILVLFTCVQYFFNNSFKPDQVILFIGDIERAIFNFTILIASVAALEVIASGLIKLYESSNLNNQ